MRKVISLTLLISSFVTPVFAVGGPDRQSLNPLFAFIPLLIILAGIGLFIYALVDIIRSEFQGNNKIIWLLVLLLLPPIGTILYLIIGRKQKLIAG